VTSGTDAGDGCGLIVNQVGVVGDVDQSAFIDFPASGAVAVEQRLRARCGLLRRRGRRPAYRLTDRGL